MRKIWKMIRPFGRLVKAFMGFCYDFRRFVSYGGWREDMHSINHRNYHLIKVYHALEKSMSFKFRKKDSGWVAANTVLDLLKIANRENSIGCHDRAAYIVLKSFIELPENNNTDKAIFIEGQLEEFDFQSSDICGAKKYGSKEFQKGILGNPEEFFFSRYSLREFSPSVVDEETIRRVVALAMKTPSVCNRQPWHIYHTAEAAVIEKALKYQAGNRGFGEKIPNLMIISTDLNAFMPGEEHYQHWIDGGLFSMSLIYALHSLGVASCCLNWSQSPHNDKLLRSVIDIKANHTVIMMLAFGFPCLENKVCVSARRPIDEIYSPLKIKK